jgi:hypothetical protein
MDNFFRDFTHTPKGKKIKTKPFVVGGILLFFFFIFFVIANAFLSEDELSNTDLLHEEELENSPLDQLSGSEYFPLESIFIEPIDCSIIDLSWINEYSDMSFSLVDTPNQGCLYYSETMEVNFFISAGIKPKDNSFDFYNTLVNSYSFEDIQWYRSDKSTYAHATNKNDILVYTGGWHDVNNISFEITSEANPEYQMLLEFDITDFFLTLHHNLVIQIEDYYTNSFEINIETPIPSSTPEAEYDSSDDWGSF